MTRALSRRLALGVAILALAACGGGASSLPQGRLGSFGQAGVDRVLEILQGELRLVMGACGTRTVADITSAFVSTHDGKS